MPPANDDVHLHCPRAGADPVFAAPLIARVTTGSQRSDFTYDGLKRWGRRVDAENGVPQGEVRAVWCQTGLCEARVADGATVTRRWLSHGEVAGAVPSYHLGDHLGGVEAVTDAAGALAARYAFDPWGGRTLAAGAEVTDVVFPGHLRHAPSGLHLTWHRALDPARGRWLSEDPADLIDGPNKYAYVRNQPVRLSDPQGLCSCADECPGGTWGVTSVNLTMAFGAGVDGGFGSIYCIGREYIRRSAKVGCALLGPVAALGFGVSGHSPLSAPDIVGPCNRRALQPTKATAWVLLFGPVSVWSTGGVGIGRSIGGGIAFADCHVTPM